MAAPKGNKFAVGNEGGRPKKYQSVEEVERILDNYFVDCDNKEKPYTVTGLALALEMGRQQLLDYGKDEKFHDTIKKAKLKCEQYAEERLFGGGQVAGVIFNMKNNYGWKDKTEQDINVSGGLADELKAARERAGK